MYIAYEASGPAATACLLTYMAREHRAPTVGANRLMGHAKLQDGLYPPASISSPPPHCLSETLHMCSYRGHVLTYKFVACNTSHTHAGRTHRPTVSQWGTYWHSLCRSGRHAAAGAGRGATGRTSGSSNSHRSSSSRWRHKVVSVQQQEQRQQLLVCGVKEWVLLQSAATS
jgi:hypothetical protein